MPLASRVMPPTDQALRPGGAPAPQPRVYGRPARPEPADEPEQEDPRGHRPDHAPGAPEWQRPRFGQARPTRSFEQARQTRASTGRTDPRFGQEPRFDQGQDNRFDQGTEGRFDQGPDNRFDQGQSVASTTGTGHRAEPPSSAQCPVGARLAGRAGLPAGRTVLRRRRRPATGR